ncbi:hypothetical protein BME89_23030, partial [Klebsiella quasipneumoniae subsp. similipneumoniae]
GMVCVVGRMRDLILQLSKSSIYSTKPRYSYTKAHFQRWRYQQFYLNPYQIQTGSIFVHYVACIFLVKNE